MRRVRSFFFRSRKQILNWLAVAAIYVLPLLAIPATGALYLKIENVKGGSSDKDHEEWIDAQSFQFGVTRNVGTKASVSELVISKPADVATPLLFVEAAAGKAQDADLELVRTVGGGVRERYYRIKLYDVLVSAFAQSSGGDRPNESVSLNFLKMELTYTEFVKGTADHETTSWYDPVTGKGGINSGPPNTAPSISSILNTNTAEDTPRTIPFTVGDAQTTPGSLSLSRSSSNLGLLPLANITFGGSGASRTVTLLPATNQTGTVNVTITVSDGSLFANTAFTLNVLATNDAPQISAIGGQSTAQDTPITVGFALSDPDNAAGSLQLFAASGDTTLVPNANLEFGGSGASRTLTITPALGQTGQTTISIRASDGLLETTNTFLLTVSTQPVNQAPSFIVSSAAVIPTIAGRPTSVTRLQVADPDAGTNVLALALQVVNGTITASNWPGTIASNGTANVFLSGSIAALNALLGASNGVIYRPNTGISGTDLLTATLNDNGHSGSGGARIVYTTLGFRIYASQYDEWLHEEFTQSELDTSTLEDTLWGFHADFDRDRLENVAEYGLGTPPRGTNHLRPVAEFTVQGGSNYLALQFNQREDPDLTLTVEVASDIAGPWSSDSAQLQTIPPVDLGNGFREVRFIDRVATSATQQRFMRMRWNLNQPFATAPAPKSTRR